MTIYATAGAKLFIGGVLAQKSTDFVAGDFTSQTWVEVGELESLGKFGDEATEIKFDGINTKRSRKLKGTRDAGTMEVVCGSDPLDAGQIALIAAEATSSDYAFKVELTDKPSSGASPKPSQRLFIAQVASVPETLEGANNVIKFSAMLRINSNVVRVAAASS